MAEYYNTTRALISVSIPESKRSVSFPSHRWVHVDPSDEGVGMIQTYRRKGVLRWRASVQDADLSVEAPTLSSDVPDSSAEESTAAKPAKGRRVTRT